MCRIRSWAWGLIALAPIMAAALVLRVAALPGEIEARVAAALDEAGHGWVETEIDGRNVQLAGLAPDDAARGEAVAVAQDVRGVRRVDHAMTLAPVVAPYAWWVEREEGVVRLGGHVPSQAIRDALRALAFEHVPEAEIIDDTGIARGAPDDLDFAHVARALIEAVGRMRHGRAALEDAEAALAGEAAEIDDYGALNRALHPRPEGLATVYRDIAPARVSPHRFVVRLADGAVRLDGHAPSVRAASFPAEEIARSRPELDITGAPEIAAGPIGESDWIAGLRYAVGRLALLGEGSVSVIDEEIRIEGRAADMDAYEAFLAGSNTPPPGFEVTNVVIGPSAQGATR